MGRKRKNGEGTVRLRKDGRWEGWMVIGYDEQKRPKTKNVLAKTKAECEEKLKVLIEEMKAEIRAIKQSGDLTAISRTGSATRKVNCSLYAPAPENHQ